jgi:NTP pyrophosphatase (non-canonical NTP hydrolase)
MTGTPDKLSQQGAAPFSIGSDIWPGLSKLIEECGEVTQVVGKIIGAHPNVDHWDGTNLRERLQEELADLSAAICFVKLHCWLAEDVIEQRQLYGWRCSSAGKWSRRGTCLVPESSLSYSCGCRDAWDTVTPPPDPAHSEINLPCVPEVCQTCLSHGRLCAVREGMGNYQPVEWSEVAGRPRRISRMKGTGTEVLPHERDRQGTNTNTTTGWEKSA